VWCARRLIGNEPFAVILPDDVIAAETPCLQQMVEAHARTGGNIVAAMEVPPAQAGAYGILDVAEDMGSLFSVRGMVEKPDPAEAPSNLAVIGRYILNPSVLRHLNRAKSGTGGEIQLTDAIAADIAEGKPVHGYRFRGQRFDCGSKAGFLQATVAFALARDDLRDDLLRFLTEVVHIDKAAQ
jgi:UTP--glucose-1-phosphate uridylyltransferase